MLLRSFRLNIQKGCQLRSVGKPQDMWRSAGFGEAFEGPVDVANRVAELLMLRQGASHNWQVTLGYMLDANFQELVPKWLDYVGLCYISIEFRSEIV